MAEFIPPYPKRPATAPGLLNRILLGRRNLIAAFEEDAFHYRLSSSRIITRKMFMFNSPAGVQFALSTHNASFERKGPQFRFAVEPMLGDSLFLNDGPIWRQRRRIVAPIIHLSRMSEFAPGMVETALDTRERWTALPPSTELDVQSEMAELTASIICRSLFGRYFGRQIVRDVVDGFTAYQSSIGLIDMWSLVGFPDWFPRPRSPKVRRAVKRVHGAIDHVLASYRANKDSEKEAVISRLLDARDEDTGEPLTDAAIRNELSTLFLAGSETTANALTWTWFLLSQDPRREAKLHREIDTVLQGRPPTLADVAKLPYTRAVFEETMRLYPPVPFLSREALTDETYEDTKIPKGSIVVVCLWLLHRHKRLWSLPDHFIPERFLNEKQPISKFAYLPFSIGPRICAGAAFGMTEGVLLLATLAQRFKLRLKEGHVVVPEARFSLRPRDGMPMTLVPRLPLKLRPVRPAPNAAAAPVAEAPGCPMGHGAAGGTTPSQN